MKTIIMSLALVILVGTHYGTYRYYTENRDALIEQLRSSEFRAQTVYRHSANNTATSAKLAKTLMEYGEATRGLEKTASDIFAENQLLRAQVAELSQARITVSRGDTVLKEKVYPAKVVMPAQRSSGSGSAVRVVESHAERYYKSLRKDGLVFDVQVSCDQPREMSGWGSRVEISGIAQYSYYTNAWGGSFTNESNRFTAQVENGRVVDFQNR